MIKPHVLGRDPGKGKGINIDKFVELVLDFS